MLSGSKVQTRWTYSQIYNARVDRRKSISSDHHKECHANFASYNYIVKHQAETENINPTLKQFWEIENVHSIWCTENERAIGYWKEVENTLSIENQMYSVCVSWKTNDAVLPDNFELALSGLENREDNRCVKHEECIWLPESKTAQDRDQRLQKLKDSLAEKR